MPDIFTAISPSGVPVDPETLRRIANDLQAGNFGKGEIPRPKEPTPKD